LAIRDHFDHIKSEGNLGIIEQTKPGERASGNLSLLKGLNVFKWPPQIFVRPRFHFDKNKRVVVAADNIDFAAGPASIFEVTIKNFVAAFPKKAAGRLFTEPSSDLFRRFR
jgi:hypothetical protein